MRIHAGKELSLSLDRAAVFTLDPVRPRQPKPALRHDLGWGVGRDLNSLPMVETSPNYSVLPKHGQCTSAPNLRP